MFTHLILALALGQAPTPDPGPVTPDYPVASLRAPATVAIGQDIVFRFGKSSGTAYLDLEMVNGPTDLDVEETYDRAGKPLGGIATPTAAGDYIFILIAGARVGDKDLRDYDFATVHVGPVTPPPVPPPGPTPGPDPPQPEPPGPDVYKGDLWCVLVTGNPATPEQAALRGSMAIRKALADLNVKFKTYNVDQADVSTPGWKKQIADAGGVPMALWITGENKVLTATKAASEAGIIADGKKIRGVP